MTVVRLVILCAEHGEIRAEKKRGKARRVEPCEESFWCCRCRAKRRCCTIAGASFSSSTSILVTSFVFTRCRTRAY